LSEQRPLFDPTRVHVPAQERSDAPPAAQLLTPRQVNALVRGAIERALPTTLRVLGEIGDLSRPGSGHLYFTLKDGQSELRCVLWRSDAARLRFTPEPGMQVIATGSVDVYEPRGEYQLVARRLEPRGVGALELAFRQLREKLEREGLFDPARKRPLPRLPRRIAIVTSLDGAALGDILRTLRRRYPPAEALLFPARVQGEGAALEIAAAVRRVSACAAALGGIDVCIVGRGGGSLEDLWAFNEEVVARAVHACDVPVISAVGHEADVSICDLVADVRAATPTAAAELATPKLDALLDHFDRAALRARRAARHTLELAGRRFAAITAREPIQRPTRRLLELGQGIDERERRLARLLDGRLGGMRRRVAERELSVARIGAGAHVAQRRRLLDERVWRAQAGLERRLAAARARTEQAAARAAGASPAHELRRHSERVAALARRAVSAARQARARAAAALEAVAEKLQACDPKRVLRRGYSVTRDARTRRVLRSTGEIRAGMRIVSELADGEFKSTADDARQKRLFDD